MYERERSLQTLAHRQLAVLFARPPDFRGLHSLAGVEPRCRAKYDLALGSPVGLSGCPAGRHRQPSVRPSRSAYMHSHRRITVDTRWLDSRSVATAYYSRRFSPWRAKHLTMRWSERRTAVRPLLR
jgi:hypothetical protein